MTPSNTTTEDGAIAIRRALVSVYDKTGIEELATALHGAGVQIVSTGSTAARIAAAGANQRNQAVARLLESYSRIYFDPAATVDLYTRQCSLNVTVVDLAVMAATLADGGVNPLTREVVIDAAHCPQVLAIMATAGMYETSGDWLYDIGLPGKSGIGGGIITVAPGKGGLGVFSPPLDKAGNSVRGQLATKFLSHELGLNLFASEPVV